MGRLSKLQKHILIEAYKKLILKDGTNYLERHMGFLANKHELGWKYLFKCEILKSYYGWTEKRYGSSLRMARFSKQKIGEKEYHKVMVTVTRTLKNLVEKGLVEVWYSAHFLFKWTGLTLTEAGIEKAKRLLEQQKS